VEWVGDIFRELKCVDFVDIGRHSCSLLGKVIKGCIALCSLDTFVFTLFNNFDHLVVLRLLQIKVDTGEFGGNFGVGKIQFNKSLVVFKVIIVPLYCCRLGLRNSRVFALSSHWWRLPQLSTILMTLSGMGRGVIKWGF
jgi:hypothetical protein